MNQDAPAIFEASFLADDVFVAVDVLKRTEDGFDLIEVKSSSQQKDEHIPDAAIQTHVLGRNGIRLRRVEIMHLNKEFRHPDQGDLFERTDVTRPVNDFLNQVPDAIQKQLDAMDGPLPDVEIGVHCSQPRKCPFRKRCWPQDPEHISKLYYVGDKKACAYMDKGVHRISDIPPRTKLSAPARRQIQALEQGCIVVEPALRQALEILDGSLGYLDFETVARAIPVWPGLGPWRQAVAQFSYHEQQPDGAYRHVGWLAEGPEDPRRELAEALLDACAGADKIVVYSSFERGRIRDLGKAVPDLAEPLQELEAKLVDLLPVIRNNVYHPDFQGSFSLKYVLTPLVPDLTYNDLTIVDGRVASVEIARLLFVAHKVSLNERDRLRQDLLDYCERDTWAMVKLLESLTVLAGPEAQQIGRLRQ